MAYMTSKTKTNKYLRCAQCGEFDYEFVCPFKNCPHTHDKIHQLLLTPKTALEKEYVHLVIYIDWYKNFVIPSYQKCQNDYPGFKIAIRYSEQFLSGLENRLETLLKSTEFPQNSRQF